MWRHVAVRHAVTHLEAVGHVHHGQRGLRPQEALVLPVLQGLVVDLHRVVGGAAPRQRLVGDDARVAHGAEIYPELPVVVLAQQLHVHLGGPVDCGGSQDRCIARVEAGRRWPEHCDGGRNEHLALVDGGDFEHVLRAARVHLHSQLRVALADSGEERRQVHDGVDVVLLHVSGR